MAEAPKIILCPYCGNTQRLPAERCETCGGFFDSLSRKVSQQHMGPWFVRNADAPFAPGCSYDVLVRQIQRGKIHAGTILRGPTTKQFWAVARNVPGVAHHLGYCHVCGANIDKGAASCPRCDTHFVEPRRRDTLGLDPDDPGVFEEARALGAGRDINGALSAASPADSVPAAPATPARARVVATTTLGPDDSGPPFRPAHPPSPPLTAPRFTAPESVGWTTDDGGSIPEPQPTPPSATRQGPSRWIWLLIGLNALLLAAAAVYLLIG